MCMTHSLCIFFPFVFQKFNSSVPTKQCSCGHWCHIRRTVCPQCRISFPPSEKRVASGPPRRCASDLLAQLH